MRFNIIIFCSLFYVGCTSSEFSSLTEESVAEASLAFTSPLPGTFVNIANEASLAVSGVCNQPDGALISFNNGDSTICSSGSFSANLDMSAAPQNGITLTATLDTAAAHLSLNKDTIRPTLFLSTPDNTAPGRDLDGVVSITTTFSEAILGLATSQYIYSNATASSGLSGGPEVYSFDIVASVPGSFSIAFPAGIFTDEAGNTNLASNTLNFIHTPPTLAFTSPLSGSFVNIANEANFAVSGTCNQPDGTIISFNFGAPTTCLSGGFSANLDMSAAPQNGVVLTATMMTATDSLALTKDTLRPTVALGAPSPATTSSSTSTNITVTIAGASNVSLTNSNIILIGDTDGCSASVINGTTSNPTITISGCTSITGTVNTQVQAGIASDVAGNSSILSNSVSANVTNSVPFVSVWQTLTPNEVIDLPLKAGYSYNFTIDWGDGSPRGVVTSSVDTDKTHTYALAGTYTVTITGLCEGFGSVTAASYQTQIRSVTELGHVGWRDLSSAFRNAVNLTSVFGGDTSLVTNMSTMFMGAGLATPDTSGWDTSNVTNMNGMFYEAASANPDVSSWDTSNVINMSFMFLEALAARPNTSGWDTSNVTDMRSMFRRTLLADPDTSGWDTSSVTNLNGMFYEAASANPDVSSWDTSNVVDMAGLFYDADSANPDVSSWDTAQVRDMAGMFALTAIANPDVSGWITNNVTEMQAMFQDTSVAAPDTSGWNTSNVTNMRAMFLRADVAAPDTSGWDTSKVVNMHFMFEDAPLAAPETSGWDTSSVTDMGEMFQRAVSANPDTSGWDTSSVTDMGEMFFGAISADPDVSSWDTSNVQTMDVLFTGAASANPDMSSWDFSSVTRVFALLSGTAVSNLNYSNFLINLESQGISPLDQIRSPAQFLPSAATARASLVSAGWSIVDGGPE